MSLVVISMMSVLIVEDDPATLDQLTKLLQEEMPGVTIHVATNVAEARILLEGTRYDVIVLDLKLPAAPGISPEPDVSLCEQIHGEGASSLVVHVTAYPDDKLLRDHLASAHSSPAKPRTVWFSKQDVGWSMSLAERVSGYVFSRLIRERLDALLGPERREIAAVGALQSAASGGSDCLTYDLAVLCSEVAQYWDVLDEALRARIRRILYVDLSSKPVRVGLSW
jgi:CheY-like chemotaxis protein